MMIAATAQGQTLQAAGAGGRVWLVTSGGDGKQVAVYERTAEDAAGEVRLAGTENGQLSRAGLAVGREDLWLVYESLVVGRVTVSAGGMRRRGPTYDFEPMLPLPGPGALRGFALVGDDAWALMRVGSAKALARIDGQAGTAGVGVDGVGVDGVGVGGVGMGTQAGRMDVELDRALGLPPGVGVGATTRPSTQPATRPTTQARTQPGGALAMTQAGGAAVDRLLVLRAGRWRKAVLPGDWPGQGPVWLVGEAGASWPTLIRRGAAGKRLMVYRHAAGGWREVVTAVPGNGVMQLLSVDRQLVVARRDSSEAGRGENRGGVGVGGGVAVRLYVLRRGRAMAVGRLAIEKVATSSAWAVAAVGSSQVGLFAREAEEAGRAAGQVAEGKGKAGKGKGKAVVAWWTAMDLDGQVTQKPVALREAAPRSLQPGISEYVLLGVVLVLAVLMMFVFWRRDPRLVELHLPEQVILGSWGKRALAGVIDIVPVMIAVMLAYRIGPVTLLGSHWPGQGWGENWRMMLPGIWVMVIFVGYTMVGELWTQRTLGKWIMGLWVTTLTGGKPVWWQVVVRCLLKAFDLVAWVLLVLPMINPLRQRLGDMVAETVVVMEKPREG